MNNLAVIVRRALRRRLKSDEGMDRVVGELLGDDWKKLLSNNRNQREGVIAQIAREMKQRLNQTSFMDADSRNRYTSIDLSRKTMVS